MAMYADFICVYKCRFAEAWNECTCAMQCLFGKEIRWILCAILLYLIMEIIDAHTNTRYIYNYEHVYKTDFFKRPIKCMYSQKYGHIYICTSAFIKVNMYVVIIFHGNWQAGISNLIKSFTFLRLIAHGQRWLSAVNWRSNKIS